MKVLTFDKDKKEKDIEKDDRANAIKLCQQLLVKAEAGEIVHMVAAWITPDKQVKASLYGSSRIGLIGMLETVKFALIYQDQSDD